MVKKQAHGWALWAAMYVLFFAGVTTAYWAEARGNPIHAARGIDVAASATQSGRQHGGQGGPLRDRQLGALRHHHDRRLVRLRQQHARLLHSLGGMVPLVNMQLGELVFGGVGAGLYGMLMMVLLTVFIAGLMVGRTPEYLGKKVESREMRMVMLYVLVFPFVILVLTGDLRRAARRAQGARTTPGRTG